MKEGKLRRDKEKIKHRNVKLINSVGSVLLLLKVKQRKRKEISLFAK
jgi:hypothetical protein